MLSTGKWTHNVKYWKNYVKYNIKSGSPYSCTGSTILSMGSTMLSTVSTM